MVRSAQKGEMETPSSEVAKAAASMSKSDVKKFASTKHKGLPMKKKVEEAYYGGEEQRKKDERKAKYEKQLKKMLPKRAFDTFGRELDPRSGKVKEETKYDRYDAEKKRFAKSDQRMKHGKNFKQFVKDIESAKGRLKRGEVKRWDKEKGRYVSNKE